MPTSTWNAIYFATFDNRAPAARTAVIQAEDESAACRIAVAQMGRCMKVHVTRARSDAFDGNFADADATDGREMLM